MKTKDQIDWRRLEKSLVQEEKKSQISRGSREVVDVLRELANIIGEYSLSRKMLYRLGIILLKFEIPKALVPVCPDYSHTEDKYDFKELRNGVPLLAFIHGEFISQIRKIVPLNAYLLIADREVEDVEIRRAVKKTEDEFNQCVNNSLLKMKEEFASKSFETMKMSHYAKDLRDLESRYLELLIKNELEKIKDETVSRGTMYNRINFTMPFEERVRRTLRTASQYLAFGHIASRDNAIIVNHTTVNLRHFSKVEAALIHNPISVY